MKPDDPDDAILYVFSITLGAALVALAIAGIVAACVAR